MQANNVFAYGLDRLLDESGGSDFVWRVPAGPHYLGKRQSARAEAHGSFC